MKKLFFLILGFAFLTGQAQDAKPVQKIFVGFNFSPDYNFRTLSSNSDKNANLGRNDVEIAKFGFTTGLNLLIGLSDLMAIETGIQFSNKGYKTKDQDLSYEQPDPNAPTKAAFKYDYHYIGVPLKAKFSFGNKNLRYSTSVGFMTNFLLNVKQRIYLEFQDGKTEEVVNSSKSGYNKLDISPMISVGIDYKLSDKIHLIAEPTFRYGLIETKDSPISEHLWNAGMNIGLYYGIK